MNVFLCASIDNLQIGERLSNLIKRKVIQETRNVQNDIAITKIEKVEPPSENSVELKLFCNIGEPITMSFEKSEFHRLHHINPDNIIFDTYCIDIHTDMDIPDDLEDVITEKLICKLENNRDNYRNDYRNYERIKVVKIDSDGDLFESDEVNLTVEIECKCPEYRMTPYISENVELNFKNLEFPFNLSKQRHISYTSIEERELPKDKLIVLEKIDGSNFGIGFIDDNTILIQSRNKVLAIVSCWFSKPPKTVKEKKGQKKEYDVQMVSYADVESVIAKQKFFDLEFIINKLVEKIVKIKSILSHNFMVFGEIFGSSLHPKKDNKNKSHLLQYYSEESHRLLNSDKVFYSAFDILLDNNFYLKYSDAIDIFEEAQLPYSKILPIQYCGNEGLLKNIETFKSQYAEEAVEGFVIKKNEDQPKYERTITKLKRQAFRETRGKNITIDNCITLNRLKNCYTKSGEDEELTIKCFISDIAEEMIKSLREEIAEKATVYAKTKLKDIRN